jgi:hypothetical protein
MRHPPPTGQRVTVEVRNDADDTNYVATLVWDQDERGAGWRLDECEPWPRNLSAETSVLDAAVLILKEGEREAEGDVL